MFALQLANEGYRVWCDLTKLVGGEVSWDNIEEGIKTRAAKVLYNRIRPGPIQGAMISPLIKRRQGLDCFLSSPHS